MVDEINAFRLIFPKLSDISDPLMRINMNHTIEMLDKHIQAKSDITVIGLFNIDDISEYLSLWICRTLS
jgi:hypothetical protein